MLEKNSVNINEREEEAKSSEICNVCIKSGSSFEYSATALALNIILVRQKTGLCTIHQFQIWSCKTSSEFPVIN